MSEESLNRANDCMRLAMIRQEEIMKRKKAKKAQRLAEHKAKYG